MNATTIEVLHVPDCPNLAAMLERLAQVTDLPLVTREVTTEAEAIGRGMAGSPTVLVNGTDPFAGPTSGGGGLSCRLYRDERGRIDAAPSVDQLRKAISVAAVAGDGPVRRRDILSAWRRAAVPLKPVERVVHQEVLRHFARTGRAPSLADLEPATAGSDRSTRDVLSALHDADALRLGIDGDIVVAYPFSATPTRHRVRVESGAEVYAMCAIDALGISAMLGRDTLITSVDPVTGETITVTMTAAAGGTWSPAAAVAFIGASAECGPSADCCCDYLNLFVDRASAAEWIAKHPDIPGEVLTQPEAEHLGASLFGSLLNDEAQRLASLIREQFGIPDLLPHLARLLAEGQPVSVAQVVAGEDWTEEQIRAELSRHPGTDWDDQGRILGFGLTLRETPHRFAFDDRVVYAFCASDALEFSVVLGRSGTITSTCPATRQRITVEITPERVVSVEPASTVVSKLRPDRAVDDVRAEICNLGNFFSSAQAATDWLTLNPHGQVASIHEDFEVTRLAMVELGWTSH
ncbi:organomercurial lyase MerB [Nocardioides speluncae]|uniref:organomercurial lyase MerB n=1 Tax=Nocardioides speluncae TaxID=2670337 RepID=UPI001F0CC2A0|nr:organomercurial lyase MerB [Nocardioides speluncae]